MRLEKGSVMGMIKGIVRRMGAPVWRRIRPVIYTRIDWRIYEYLQRHGVGQGDTSWEQLVPAFLNAVSTVQTFGRELALVKKAQAEQIARLEGEIASLRAQLEAHRSRPESELVAITDYGREGVTDQ